MMIEVQEDHVNRAMRYLVEMINGDYRRTTIHPAANASHPDNLAEVCRGVIDGFNKNPSSDMGDFHRAGRDLVQVAKVHPSHDQFVRGMYFGARGLEPESDQVPYNYGYTLGKSVCLRVAEQSNADMFSIEFS